MKSFILIIGLLFSVQLAFGQCYSDRHNTSWFEGWISCDEFPSPNEIRGDGHWILYDFKKTYRLGNSHIWNVNDPLHLARGLQDVAIDYSIDGDTWVEAGTYVWDQGSGSSIYEGVIGPNFDGLDARFVLITALSNYGDDCYGFSEIRFEAEELDDVIVTSTRDREKSNCLEVALYPNPVHDQGRMMIQTYCADEIRYSVMDVLGREVFFGDLPSTSALNDVVIDARDFPAGTYLVSVRQGIQEVRKQLLKVR